MSENKPAENHNDVDDNSKPLSEKEAADRAQAVLAELSAAKEAYVKADAVLEEAHTEKKRVLSELAAKHDKRREALEAELNKEYIAVSEKAQSPVTEAAADANTKVDAYRATLDSATDAKSGGLFQKSTLKQLFGFGAPGPARR